MKKLAMLMMVMALVLGLSVASYAASTNGGTETMGINATLDPYGMINVMGGGLPWNLTFERNHFNAETDPAYTMEDYIRVRFNAGVNVTAKFGPLVGQEWGFVVPYTMNFTYNDYVVDGIHSSQGQDNWIVPNAGFYGEFFADVTLIPELPANWYQMPADTYSTNVVFTIALVD